MVRLRRAGGVTSRTMFWSLAMVTASPARGTLPPGQDDGLDQSDSLAGEAAALADAGIFMPACASWANAGAAAPSIRAAGSSMERRDRRDGVPMALVLSQSGLRAPVFL